MDALKPLPVVPDIPADLFSLARLGIANNEAYQAAILRVGNAIEHFLRVPESPETMAAFEAAGVACQQSRDLLVAVIDAHTACIVADVVLALTTDEGGQE